MKKIILSILIGVILLFSELVTASSSAPILVGADRIVTSPYANILLHKRLALLTNHGSRNAAGVSTIDVLRHNPGFHLVALFSAEHGIDVSQDTGFDDTRDPISQLPVYSLYGKNYMPSEAALKNIDVIVIDLQDMGLRFYTFGSTVALILKAAKKYHKQVVILDRVNPLSGTRIEGAVAEKTHLGETSINFPIPMRYGLTLGELALYYNKYFNVDASLTIVPLKNWQRADFFNQTGLQWRAPSPALPTFDQAFLYGTFGVLEGTALDVGRNVHNKMRDAFRHYGASWISAAQARQLVLRLNQLHLPGLTFSEDQWISQSIFPGILCHGFRVKVLNYHQVRSFYSLLETMKILYQLFGDKLNINHSQFMLGSPSLVEGIKKNLPTEILIRQSEQSWGNYLSNRQQILLYR